MRPSSNDTQGEQLGVASQARQAEIASVYTSHGVRRDVHYGGSSDRQWPRALFFGMKEGPIVQLRGGGASLRGMAAMMGSDTAAQEAALRAGRGNGIVGATMSARSVWGGDVMVHRTAPEDVASSRNREAAEAAAANPNYMQELADVQEAERQPPSSWSDRWFPNLHAKSLNELHDYREGVAKFDVFTHGYEVMAGNGSEQTEEIFESFRCQLEDCDRVQGFQIMVDCDSGFGGLSHDFLVECVREECRTKPILTYGLMDSLTMSNSEMGAEGRSEASGRGGSAGVTYGGGGGGGGGGRGDSTMRSRAIAYRSINQALALSTLADISDVFVPIHAASLHSTVESTAWRGEGGEREGGGAMPPLHEHQAASMLAASLDTIILPFRIQRPQTIGGTTVMRTTTTMSQLVRSVAPRRELNVASLLTRYVMPRKFPALKTRRRRRGGSGTTNIDGGREESGRGERSERENEVEVVEEWSDLHAYLSRHAPLHRQGNGASVTMRSGADGGARNDNGGGEDTSTGHSAKTMGTSSYARSYAAGRGGDGRDGRGDDGRGGSSGGGGGGGSEEEEDLPCLLWSLSGSGMRTAHSSEDDDTNFARSAVTYGVHAVVRGYREEDTVVVGRHEVSQGVCLDMYVRRASCRSDSSVVSSHVVSAPLAVPSNASRKIISGEDENEERMEREAMELMELEMMKRFQARRGGGGRGGGGRGGGGRGGGGRGGGGEREDDAQDSSEPDWKQKSQFQVEEMACFAALDISPRVYPLLRRTADQLKRRPKGMLFEYEKGAKGVDADQFEEIVESLMSRADAYDDSL